MGLAVQSLVPSTARHTVLYKSCHLSPPTWIQCLLGPKSERAADRELTLSSAIIALLSHAGLAGLVIGGGGGGGSGCNACTTAAPLPQLPHCVSTPPVCPAALWNCFPAPPHPPPPAIHSGNQTRDKGKRCRPLPVCPPRQQVRRRPGPHQEKTILEKSMGKGLGFVVRLSGLASLPNKGRVLSTSLSLGFFI